MYKKPKLIAECLHRAYNKLHTDYIVHLAKATAVHSEKLENGTVKYTYSDDSVNLIVQGPGYTNIRHNRYCPAVVRFMENNKQPKNVINLQSIIELLSFPNEDFARHMQDLVYDYQGKPILVKIGFYDRMKELGFGFHELQSIQTLGSSYRTLIQTVR